MSNAPAYFAFAVRERDKGKKAVWTRIGTVWSLKERDGFSLEIEALPVNFDGRLVLMPPKAAQDGGPA
ncbi:hypothetical protein A33M_4000 [Rhodovulum sp. PH10]|uniref:hypothetical protein n=1 Tax=Rhodovulum sp. PH10 TaxID=1187851 RepID=UPI00027C23C8|nr:hypothetical protein [Rhodovulum sp. PH10]EJW10839.1 hypothetical protein A33M_4000 [Rhodovulum sp. PH10]